MSKFLSVITLLLAASCTSLGKAPTKAASWCFEEHEQGRREKLTRFTLVPVKAELMAESVQMLKQDSVVEVSYKRAEILTGGPARSADRHYLVRSNVTTAPGASLSQIIDVASTQAKYDMFWSPQDQSLALFVSQSVPGERQDNNIASILSVAVPVKKVYLGCWVTD
jgi:hypothetical protein